MVMPTAAPVFEPPPPPWEWGAGDGRGVFEIYGPVGHCKEGCGVALLHTFTALAGQVTRTDVECHVVWQRPRLLLSWQEPLAVKALESSNEHQLQLLFDFIGWEGWAGVDGGERVGEGVGGDWLTPA